MKLQSKNIIKRFICLTLVTGILVSNSATVFAAEPKTSEKSNFDLMADLVSERHYLDEELDKIGMSLDAIYALPQMDDSFYAEIEALTADALPASISTYSEEPTIQTLEAKRLAYAAEMAQWSVAQKSGRIFDKEMVYMYLSHYIDVTSPLDPSNGISDNSENGPFAKYICQYDRDTYDLYLSKGSAFQAARDIKNFASFGLSSSSNVKDAIGLTKTTRNKLNKVFYVLGAGLTALNGAGVIDTIKTEVTGGKTPEEIIKSVQYSLDPTYGRESESIAKEVVGFVFSVASKSVTKGGVGMALAGITIDLSTAIFDRVNFLGMRSYYNFRWADRFDYWLYGTMS